MPSRTCDACGLLKLQLECRGGREDHGQQRVHSGNDHHSHRQQLISMSNLTFNVREETKPVGSSYTYVDSELEIDRSTEGAMHCLHSLPHYRLGQVEVCLRMA